LIPLSLGHVVLVYAAGLVAALLLLWLCGGFARALGERRRRRHFIQCMHCGSLYENPTDEPQPACPQCAQANERRRTSSL
jgi:rRNA maturation endonuclease Nob1